MRFRENKIGVISDIEKAFLQISLDEADCEYLSKVFMLDNIMIAKL